MKILCLALVLASLCACPLGGAEMNLDDYDRSCAQDSDCVVVGRYPCGACDCPSSAISSSESDRYQADYDAVFCGPPVAPVMCDECSQAWPRCQDGTCAAEIERFGGDAGSEDGG